MLCEHLGNIVFVGEARRQTLQERNFLWFLQNKESEEEESLKWYWKQSSSCFSTEAGFVFLVSSWKMKGCACVLLGCVTSRYLYCCMVEVATYQNDLF